MKQGMHFGDILWKVCELSKYSAEQMYIRYNADHITGMILRCMILPNIPKHGKIIQKIFEHFTQLQT